MTPTTTTHPHHPQIGQLLSHAIPLIALAYGLIRRLTNYDKWITINILKPLGSIIYIFSSVHIDSKRGLLLNNGLAGLEYSTPQNNPYLHHNHQMARQLYQLLLMELEPRFSFWVLVSSSNSYFEPIGRKWIRG